MPVPIPETPGDDKQRGHRDQIAGTRPLDLRHARVEIALQAGLRHEQDGAVQRDDHRACRADQKGEPSLFG